MSTVIAKHKRCCVLECGKCVSVGSMKKQLMTSKRPFICPIRQKHTNTHTHSCLHEHSQAHTLMNCGLVLNPCRQHLYQPPLVPVFSVFSTPFLFSHKTIFTISVETCFYLETQHCLMQHTNLLTCYWRNECFAVGLTCFPFTLMTIIHRSLFNRQHHVCSSI